MPKIKIDCFYCSYTDRKVLYYDIVNGTDVMDDTDYMPSDFWCSLGGFSIIEDSTVLFSGYNFYNMVKASTFLLNTLYWLAGKDSDWFNKLENPDELSIAFGMGEKLTIKNKNLIEVSLSYSGQNVEDDMEDVYQYFENITINKQEWIEAVKTGLNAYFLVLLQVGDVDHSSSKSQVMKQYYSLWNQIK